MLVVWIWLVKLSGRRDKFVPTLDGLKIKHSEHAFLPSDIVQNPIPDDFIG